MLVRLQGTSPAVREDNSRPPTSIRQNRVLVPSTKFVQGPHELPIFFSIWMKAMRRATTLMAGVRSALDSSVRARTPGCRQPSTGRPVRSAGGAIHAPQRFKQRQAGNSERVHKMERSSFRNASSRIKPPSGLRLPPPPATLFAHTPAKLNLTAPPRSPSTAYSPAPFAPPLKSISETETQQSPPGPSKRHRQKRQQVIHRSASPPQIISTTTTRPFHTHPPPCVHINTARRACPLTHPRFYHAEI